MLPTNNDNQSSQVATESMELNDEFVKLQSCLYSILKAKKKLKAFKDTFTCSAELIEDVDLKLRYSYTTLINILDSHSCDCSESESDSDSEDVVQPQDVVHPQ